MHHATEGWDEGTVFFVHGSEVGLPEHEVIGITNFHVIENSAQHVARVFSSTGGHYDCQIIHVCPELDFAVLEIPHGVFTPGTVDCAIPECGEAVVIPGFPLNTDSDSCQFSYGNVSAPIGDQWLQCSLSCNNGNSGGPLIVTSTLSICGICTATPHGSEGITLALPMLVVTQAIKKFGNSQCVLIHIPQLLSSVTPVTKSWSKLTKCGTSGLVVSNVCKNCPLRSLKQGDVIVDVNGHPANEETGKICAANFPWEVDLESISAWVLFPVICTLHVKRAGLDGLVAVTVDTSNLPLHPLRQLYPLWEKIPVLSFCGAYCVPLCKNVIDAYEDYADSKELRACWQQWDSRNTLSSQLVVVVFVEPHSHASECGVKTLHLFKSISGRPVSSTAEVAEALKPLRKTRSKTVEIEFFTQTVAVDLRAKSDHRTGSDLTPMILL